MRVGVLPYGYEPDTNPYQKLFCDSLESHNVEVERITNRRWFPQAEIASRDIDVLHMDWLSGYYLGRNAILSQLKSALLIRRLNNTNTIKKVWTIHNAYQHEKGESEFEGRIVQRIIESCDALMVHTQAAKDIIGNEYAIPAGIPFEVIPHGHYIDAYENRVTKSAARRTLELSDVDKVVLFFGRLRKYKGIEDLVLAFRRCSNPNDALVIAGLPFPDYSLDELHETIARYCADRTVIVHDRHIKDVELQHFFNACDVVALPFRSILNSGSLLLAMSFGKPVVAPRIGSIPEVACPDSYFGYEIDAPDGLVQALHSSLNSPILNENVIETISHTRQKYDWETIGTQLVQLYNRLLATKHT